MPLISHTAYVGTWINHSKGPILGRTWTIPIQYASVLTALLVMLVGAAGVASWQLTCFVVHHSRSTSRAKDGLFHQQQVILRSHTPAINTILRLLKLTHRWRKKTPKSFKKSYQLIFLGLINLITFLVAALLISRITTGDNEVLARGKCGFVKGSLEDLRLGVNASERLVIDMLYQAAYSTYRDESAYTRSCYSKQFDKSSSTCKTYTRPFLPSIRSDNTTCPFASKACLDGAISLDTGRISSQDLGINSKLEEQVHVRKRMTCAPIALESYASEWTSEKKPGVEHILNKITPDDMYRYYYLGPRLLNGVPVVDYSMVLSKAALSTQSQAYLLSTGEYHPEYNSTANLFIPIEDIRPKTADLTILTMTRNIAYTSPVEDAWFKANKSGNSSSITDLYQPNAPVTALGCLEEYQFCNGNVCTPFSGITAFVDGNLTPKLPSIGLSKMQVAIYELLITYWRFMQITPMVNLLQDELLLAKQYAYQVMPVSSALEQSHWRNEVENIHNLTLAGLQAHAVFHAAPGNITLKASDKFQDFVNPETTPEHQHLCNNQKFRSAAYTSISLFSLTMVVVLCCTAILLDFTVPVLVRKLRIASDSTTAWHEDDILQLQKSVLEAKGLGPWSESGGVPVLKNYGQVFSRSDSSFVERMQMNDLNVPLYEP